MQEVYSVKWSLPLAEREYTLIGYGFVKVFKIITPDGDFEVNALPEVSSGKHCGDFDYWATNDLSLSELQRLQFAEFCWAIEDYHRGFKQCCGAEQAQVRSSQAQHNHVELAIRAFLRLELHMCATGISWHESKLAIVRDAIRFMDQVPIAKQSKYKYYSHR